MWTQSATYFIDSKTNEFTNNYTIDNAQYRVEGKISNIIKIPILQNFSGLQPLSIKKTF